MKKAVAVVTVTRGRLLSLDPTHRGHRSAHSGALSAAIVALVMAMTGSAGAPRAQLLHTGAGTV